MRTEHRIIPYLSERLFYHLIEAFKTFKEKGGRAGFNRLVRVIGRVFYERLDYLILACPLSNEIPLPCLEPGLEIRRIMTVEEIACLSAVEGLSGFIPDHINWLRKVFEDGGSGFIAWCDAQPVGCGWISRNTDSGLMRIKVPLQPGDAYLHTLFVSSGYRGQGIGRALICRRLQFLREHGYQRAIAAIFKNNEAALKIMIGELGYIRLGRVIYTRFLLWDSLQYDYE